MRVSLGWKKLKINIRCGGDGCSGSHGRWRSCRGCSLCGRLKRDGDEGAAELGGRSSEGGVVQYLDDVGDNLACRETASFKCFGAVGEGGTGNMVPEEKGEKDEGRLDHYHCIRVLGCGKEFLASRRMCVGGMTMGEKKDRQGRRED